MKKCNILRTGSLMLLLILFLSTSTTVIQAQEVRDAAATKGVKFGSPLFQLFDSDHRQLFRDQISVGTVTTYWKFNTHDNEGYYTWSDSDTAVEFGEQNGWELHGHPLVWGSDTFIPDWVKNKPTWQAEAIMLDHIRTVAGRYRGRIGTWDVVNEAIEDDGTYRDCYWNRAMTGEYIAKAFIEAKNTDSEAVLLYNDYGIETNGPKFNTVKSMLNYIRSLGAQVDGLGWQLHVYVDDVLDPNFPLEQRMQEISDMGLDNYVTELDVRIPDNSGYQLERQKQAYKKIAEIFLRNPTRGPYFQTWGITDKYTWFNDYDPGNAPHHPLPFGYNFEKKPAYWGLFEAFSDGNEPNEYSGEWRIKNLWSNSYLHQNGGLSGGDVTLHELQENWESQQWNITTGPAGSHRLYCNWGNNYLQNTADVNDANVVTQSLNLDWWSQMWFVEQVQNDVYRFRNRWTDRYLHTGDRVEVSTYDLNTNWSSQLWTLERVDDNNDDLTGELRIKNLWSNTYLHQNGGTSGGDVTLHNLESEWYSQRWNIEKGPADSYRLSSSWGGNYLHNNANTNDAAVSTQTLNEDWWSQMWLIENVQDNVYRLKNRWTNRYLHTGNQVKVSTYDLNTGWYSQMWAFEYISNNNRETNGEIIDLTISPNPVNDVIYLDEFSDNTDYIIYDTSGKIVAEGTSASIEVKHLTAGVYLLTAFPQDEEYKGVFGRALFIKK